MDAKRIAAIREWANQGQIDAHFINECLDAIEELRAVQPKTADDVLVVPGMEVWFRLFGLPHQLRNSLVDSVQIDIAGVCVYLKTAVHRNADELYSTREAAEAGGDE